MIEHRDPTFSIVVPTYSRDRQLTDCLAALSCQDYPRDRFEVIVVDDGSPTPPEGVVSSFHDRLSVSLLRQNHAGPAAARNTGAAKATGKFIAFTDDDCSPAPDWLRSLAARFAGDPLRALGGRTLNALPGNVYAAASQTLIDTIYTSCNADPNQARFFASNNLAVPSDRFQSIGGFDASFPLAAGEDRDFCDRWLGRGYGLSFAPEAVVYHAHALTLRSFWRQQLNYGRGAHCFRASCDRRGSQGFTPKLSFYLSLARRPLTQRRERSSIALAALLGLSQAAITIGFALERRSRTTTSDSRAHPIAQRSDNPVVRG